MRHSYPNGDISEGVSVVFECCVTGGELKAEDGESTEFRYLPPHEVARLAPEFPLELFTHPGPEALF